MTRIFSPLLKAKSFNSFVSSTKVTSFILIFFLMFHGCSGLQEERNLFLKGRELVVMGRYKEAVPVIKKYMSLYPRGDYSSRAYLFLGKAYLGQSKLDDAARVFDDGSSLFPQTLEGHKCRYKRAVIDLLQKNNKAALLRFQILANNPDGPLSAEARAFQLYLSD